MKKLLVVLMVIALLLTAAVPVFAVKKAELPGKGNVISQEKYRNMYEKHIEKHGEIDQNKIEKYDFFLSGDVMVLPYGQFDIAGSDEASKLTVTNVNGLEPSVLTGKMGGLTPLTSYTVYVAKSYEKTVEAWDIKGEYEMTYVLGSVPYNHLMTIDSVVNNVVTGYGSSNAAMPEVVDEMITGILSGSALTLTVTRIDPDTKEETGYFAVDTLVINDDGTLVGVWTDSSLFSGSVTTEDKAEEVLKGTAYPGLLTSNIQPFTFMTDEEGEGTWKATLYKTELTFNEGESAFSVWINGPTGVENGVATLLISENITLMEE
ncbi:MAG: hypothetical protein JXQ23_13440 [Clostridia bacterium]|nr:hypothetical protein [Clostridia bacterium]